MFDPDRIHETYNFEAAFGGTIPVVKHCHHCSGIGCSGSCLIRRRQGPVGCVHYGIPADHDSQPKEQP